MRACRGLPHNRSYLWDRHCCQMRLGQRTHVAEVPRAESFDSRELGLQIPIRHYKLAVIRQHRPKTQDPIGILIR